MWPVEAVGTRGINIFWVGDQGYIGLKQFVFKGGSPHLFPVLTILTRIPNCKYFMSRVAHEIRGEPFTEYS